MSHHSNHVSQSLEFGHQPRQKIIKVNPRWASFPLHSGGAHMANTRLDMSQQKLRSEIKDMQEDIDLYLKYLDDKMDRLVRALGIRDFE